eukprot:scaffold16163_cov49-Phaeocystis_antarctica.AAC.2
MPTGRGVRITGLQGRPELNGTCATVVEWVDSKGRYRVKLPDREVVSLKPVNLVDESTSSPLHGAPKAGSARSARYNGRSYDSIDVGDGPGRRRAARSGDDGKSQAGAQPRRLGLTIASLSCTAVFVTFCVVLLMPSDDSIPAAPHAASTFVAPPPPPPSPPLPPPPPPPLPPPPSPRPLP